MKRTILLVSALALSACAQGPGLFNGNAAPDPAATPNANATDPNATDPNADPNAANTDTAQNNSDTNTNTNTNTTTVATNTPTVTTTVTPPVVETPAPPPPETARTVEEFDTTTPEQRDVAVVETPAPETAGDGRLGTTVASIGAADEPGFWIKTPLVNAQASGRLFYPASGRTVQVQLIPSGGASGSGSQVSLAALRLLDAPLDGLPELVVYQN